jgi:hypothetical protein
MCSPFLVIEGPLGLSNYCFSIDPQRIWLEYPHGCVTSSTGDSVQSLQTRSDLTEVLGVPQLCFNPLSHSATNNGVDSFEFLGGRGWVFLDLY